MNVIQSDKGFKPLALREIRDSLILAKPLILDVLVNDLVIVECKATTNWNSIFVAQALTYLRVTGLKLALVINFGAGTVAEGIKRVVNKL